MRELAGEQKEEQVYAQWQQQWRQVSNGGPVSERVGGCAYIGITNNGSGGSSGGRAV